MHYIPIKFYDKNSKRHLHGPPPMQQGVNDQRVDVRESEPAVDGNARQRGVKRDWESQQERKVK